MPAAAPSDAAPARTSEPAEGELRALVESAQRERDRSHGVLQVLQADATRRLDARITAARAQASAQQRQRAQESVEADAAAAAVAVDAASDAEHRGLSGTRLRTTTTPTALGDHRVGEGGRALATRLAPRGTRTGAIQAAAARLALEMGIERELCIAVVQRYGLPRGRMELRNAANALPSRHLRELRDDVHACIARHLSAVQWERRMHFLVASERESAAATAATAMAMATAAAATTTTAATATTLPRPRSARSPPSGGFYERTRRASYDATPAPPPPTPALLSPSLSGGGTPANNCSPSISRQGSRPSSRPSSRPGSRSSGSRRTSSFVSLAELGVFAGLPAAVLDASAASPPPHVLTARDYSPAVRSFASLCDMIKLISITVGEGAALLISASAEAEEPGSGGNSRSATNASGGGSSSRAGAREDEGGAANDALATSAGDAPIDALLASPLFCGERAADVVGDGGGHSSSSSSVGVGAQDASDSADDGRSALLVELAQVRVGATAQRLARQNKISLVNRKRGKALGASVLRAEKSVTAAILWHAGLGARFASSVAATAALAAAGAEVGCADTAETSSSSAPHFYDECRHAFAEALGLRKWAWQRRAENATRPNGMIDRTRAEAEMVRDLDGQYISVRILLTL